MKTKFNSNSELTHIWANQVQDEGEANSMFFNGGRLFSFRTCFAQIVGDYVIFNNHCFSSYTSRHQSKARAAIHGKTLININLPGRGRDHLKFNQVEFNEILVNHGESEAEEMLIKASRARKHRDLYLSWANDIYKSLKQYADAFGLVYELPADLDQLEQAAVNAAKNRAEIEKAKRAARIIEQAENLQKWRNGEDVRTNFEFTALRLKGDVIETTRGANIPADHARKIWPLLAKLKQAGQTYTRGEKSHNLGHYVIDSFDGDTLRVGCHVIPWAEVANMAEVLKIA